MALERVDFFISYAGPDRPWAEWAAWQLTDVGFVVELDVWDWESGDNIVLRMNDAVMRADRVLAIFSSAYFEEFRFTTDEWTAVVGDRHGLDGLRRLVPVRVEPVDPPSLLAPLLCRDLFGLGQQAARAELLAAVSYQRRPTTEPALPTAGVESWVDSGPRLPGTLPRIWNLPLRNPAFTGRDALLAALRLRLVAGDRALVQALHGMGGVGKTQLVIEYAYLFAGDYELVWWINAERTELIDEQLSALGVRAGWVRADTPMSVTVVADRLRGMRRWLVVFDNAETADHVRPWLPTGPGHLVITSRDSRSGGVATPVEVRVFSRAESVELLQTHLPNLAAEDAARLSVALGDLPLALAQAAGLLAETGMTAAEYLDELAEHAGEVLDDGPAPGYPVSLGAVVMMSVDRLVKVDPAAVKLLLLCARLAPEPVPLSWFVNAPAEVLRPPLAAVVRSRLAFRHTLGRLAGLGLARVSGEAVQIHRLTQAILRDRGDTDPAGTLLAARTLIAAAEPDDPSDPVAWPGWMLMLPHLLLLDPIRAVTLRRTACRALWFLLMRGDYRMALRLAETWYRSWLETAGPADEPMLWAASELAVAYRLMGHYEDAARLDEDLLDRSRRILGDDDPDTLSSANNLANDLRLLGEFERSHALDADTFDRRHQVLGQDDPATLSSAGNLAVDLHLLGAVEEARTLNVDTLDRRRRTIGDDHPDTLASVSNLACDLYSLGAFAEARRLDEDTLDRRRRVLGEDHPHTLTSANNLAVDLDVLGHANDARRLHEDTLIRRCRVLGEDHPFTLASKHNLDESRSSDPFRQFHHDTQPRRYVFGTMQDADQSEAS
jgi:hypothetical protein